MKNKPEELTDIKGIGKTSQEKLKDIGIKNVDDFIKADFYDIANQLGYVRAYKAKSQISDVVVSYRGMKEVKEDKMNGPLNVGNKKIKPKKEIKQLQPNNFEMEISTTWSFEERGDWATHDPSFRGNWSPKVARNLILRYSEKGDTVLDPMVGGGTTLIECLLTGRNGIGIDVNLRSARLTKNRINFPSKHLKQLPNTTQKVYTGDCRNLNKINGESVDLIATHPPYANIIKYGKEALEGDLSAIPSYDIFANEIRKAAREFFRVLKPGKYCGILIGDTHKRCHYVPIAFKVMNQFLKEGFILKEDVIKAQWNCDSTPMWKNQDNDFLLTMHEHLFIFRKPNKDEDINIYKNSSNSFVES